MSVQAGQQLLHYRLTGKLGEGGMGQVWEAADTTLDRRVAIKILPESFVQDPERLARFEREAKLLASLNHPNIAAVYSVHADQGLHFLAMELVEGEDLSTRLQRGPLEVELALTLAGQIADALEAAHEKGVIHRDLKPANLRITPEGNVKVLDFGLAKAFGAEGDAGADPTLSPSLSPTITSAGTQAGMILGTAAYMSPEQAKGRAVDTRADIWAFGAVLHEMLTGEPTFKGETVSELLASVLRDKPDMDQLPAEVPAEIRQLLLRCLNKAPRQRLRHIGDARLVIQDALAGGLDAGAQPAAAPEARHGGWLPWLIAAAAVVALVLSLLVPRGSGSPQQSSYELSLKPPPGSQLVVGSNVGWGAVSPDGTRVVARVSGPEGTGLWVRSLDGTGDRLLPRTEEGFYPFWSPDGRWVAFFERGSLQRIEVDGGLPERVCIAPTGRGGSWSETGRILLTPAGGGAVHVVPATGGDPRPVTRLNPEAGEDAHYWPTWLPDGEGFIYFIRSRRREEQGVYLGRVPESGYDDERRRIVASSSSGVLVPGSGGDPARLLWVEEGALLARAFDPVQGTVSGPTGKIAEGVRVLESQRASMISAATSARHPSLLWASADFGGRRLAWYDRDGRVRDVVDMPPGALYEVGHSPDGRWATFVPVVGGQGDIWLLDTSTDAIRALVSTATYEEGVAWSPDSTEIILERGGIDDNLLLRMRIDGSDTPRPVLGNNVSGRKQRGAEAWLPGDWLILTVLDDQGTTDLITVHLGAPDEAFDLLVGPADLTDTAASPGGRALAFVSNDSGRVEAYVVSLTREDGHPALGPDRRLLPVVDPVYLAWNEAGDRLYCFTAGGSLFEIPIDDRQGSPVPGTPKKLFDLPAAANTGGFGVVGDEPRFLFSVDTEARYETLSILVGWKNRLE